MKKIDAFKFFNKEYSVQEYSDMYKKLRLDIRYPANVKREQIFVKLLKKYKKLESKKGKILINEDYNFLKLNWSMEILNRLKFIQN